MSAVMIALGIPAALYAQDPRLKARLAPAALEIVGPIIDSARSSGLPTEPLVQKALQGAAKGADASRIGVAVRRLSDDMGVARRALGNTAPASELEVSAAALRVGVREEQLARLHRTRPERSLLVPLSTLIDLVARGVSADAATSVLTSLLSNDVSDDDLVTLQRDVERDARGGVPAAAAASIRGRAIAAAAQARNASKKPPQAGPKKPPPAHAGGGPPDHPNPGRGNQ